MKLCLFCNHFNWSAREMWGMGSTATGPMFDGGSANCGKGHSDETWLYPDDEVEYRKIVIHAETCPDYDQVKV